MAIPPWLLPPPHAGLLAPPRAPVMPPNPMAQIGPWVEARTPDNRVYFFHQVTREVRWDRPVLPVLPPGWSMHFAPTGQPYYFNSSTQESTYTLPTLPAAPAAAPKRISSKQPIPGTTWVVVREGNGKTFFFNSETRKSVRQLPPELEGVPIPEPPVEPGPDATASTHAQPQVTLLGTASLDDPAIKRARIDTTYTAPAPGPDGSAPVEDSLPADLLAQAEEMAEEYGVIEEDESSAHTRVDPEAQQRAIEAAEAAAEREEALQAIRLLPPEERVALFKQILTDAGVSAFASWEEEEKHFRDDPVWAALTGKERRHAFDSYQKERIAIEAEQRRKALQNAREEFTSLLCEQVSSFKTTFVEFQDRARRDPRFMAVEKLKDREALFREHVEKLKAEAKDKSKGTSARDAFFAMLKEHHVDGHTRWDDIRAAVKDDARMHAIEAVKREPLFRQYQATTDKSLRADESLRQREAAVRRDRARLDREAEHGLAHINREDATTVMRALLADHVKAMEPTWESVQASLKADDRWTLTEPLGGEREALFRSYLAELRDRTRIAFHRAIEQNHQILLSTPYAEARVVLQADPRFERFGENEEERKNEYTTLMSQRLLKAKDDFRELLRETKCISHTSLAQIEAGEAHMKEIQQALTLDKRYHQLAFIDDERVAILQQYLQDLQDRGPPPPPTATLVRAGERQGKGAGRDGAGVSGGDSGPAHREHRHVDDERHEHDREHTRHSHSDSHSSHHHHDRHHDHEDDRRERDHHHHSDDHHRSRR